VNSPSPPQAPPMIHCQLQAQGNRTKLPWTETFETMSQNKPFLF
jgi:hypothetical protein